MIFFAFLVLLAFPSRGLFFRFVGGIVSLTQVHLHHTTYFLINVFADDVQLGNRFLLFSHVSLSRVESLNYFPISLHIALNDI